MSVLMIDAANPMHGAVSFATTRWSVVTAAGNRGSPDAAAALDKLSRPARRK